MDQWNDRGGVSKTIHAAAELGRNPVKQHFGEIKNEVFFKERRLLRLKGPVGETCLIIIVCPNKCFKVTTHICDNQQNLETPYKNVEMFPIAVVKFLYAKCISSESFPIVYLGKITVRLQTGRTCLVAK